jgi:predicted O-methyltransferase YrrM
VPDFVNLTLRFVTVSDIGLPRWMTPFAQHVFEIPTHMTPQERLMLLQIGLNAGQSFTALEIGSYLGASTAFLALAATQRDGNVHAVDTWTNIGMGAEGERDTFTEFLRYTAPFRQYITTHRGDSIEIARRLGSIRCDLLFIDGSHNYDAVVADLRAWLPSLKPSGTLAMHDIDAASVKRAFDDVIGDKVEAPPQVVERLLICRPKLPVTPVVQAS